MKNSCGQNADVSNQSANRGGIPRFNVQSLGLLNKLVSLQRKEILAHLFRLRCGLNRLVGRDLLSHESIERGIGTIKVSGPAQQCAVVCGS